jgi:hypothetical protein
LEGIFCFKEDLEMATRKLRRPKSTVSKTGVEVTSCYCRKCMETKKPTDFYQAVDNGMLDANGYFSVCKECCAKIYVGQYSVTHDLGKAIYNTCRILNIRFDDGAISSTKMHLETQGKTDDDPKTFGIYKSKVVSKNLNEGENAKYNDYTFQEHTIAPVGNPMSDDAFEEAVSVKEFWGDGLELEDYRFLEKELADWKKSYAISTKADEFYIRQICLRILEIEKVRTAGNSPDSVMKSLQTLLKDAGLTPAQQTAASSGKGVETWGTIIKTIGETSPEEYYKNKELFKDFDNLGDYLQKYLTRPLKNFVTGSRDFNIVDIDDGFDEYEENGDDDGGKTE